MTHHAHGKPSNEFRFEAELDEIRRLSCGEHLGRVVDWRFACREADSGLAQAPSNDLLQTAKGAADDEQNMFGIDCGRRFASALSKIHHRLDLAGDIIL